MWRRSSPWHGYHIPRTYALPARWGPPGTRSPGHISCIGTHRSACCIPRQQAPYLDACAAPSRDNAPRGQRHTQSPHPVQRSASMHATASTRMAPKGQARSQTPQPAHRNGFTTACARVRPPEPSLAIRSRTSRIWYSMAVSRCVRATKSSCAPGGPANQGPDPIADL